MAIDQRHPVPRFEDLRDRAVKQAGEPLTIFAAEGGDLSQGEAPPEQPVQGE